MKGLSTSETSGAPAILDRLSALADPIRCRILLVLDRQELTVSELCSVLQLAQSTVSRHLKILSDDGWISVRPEGTSRFYSAAAVESDDAAHRLWALVGDEVAHSPAAEQDRTRLRAILARRRSRSQEFFSSAAERWAELRREMFGREFDLRALPALLDDDWVLGDLGCGTGEVAAGLAPFVARVIAVDASESMLEAARQRLAGAENVDLRQGQLEELPIADAELDAATVMLVLHHSGDPQAQLHEVARSLKPGGRLLLVDMLPHDHDEYRKQMGHVWLGFEPEQIEEMLAAAGFDRIRVRPLEADPEAKGPTLFAASATRNENRQPKGTRPAK
jgi:ArsR family transcriptional regulator